MNDEGRVKTDQAFLVVATGYLNKINKTLYGKEKTHYTVTFNNINAFKVRFQRWKTPTKST
jgi:hypothetical protein